MDSLFDSLDEAKRSRLRRLGWTEKQDDLRGKHRRLWRDPKLGAYLEEDEAFRRLEHEEQEHGVRKDQA